jgi:hypothetical protein
MSKPEGYYVDDVYGAPPRRERGCFFYGCLFTAILAAIAVVFVVILGVFAFRFASRTLNQYTDTVPMPIPASTLSKEETDEVVARAKAFKEAVNEGHAATLTLTGPELNALLNSEPNIAGKASVDIVGDELRGWASIPFDLPFFGRRYLNGKGALRASIEDGEPVVHVQDFEVKGRPLPPDVLKQAREKNLAEEFRPDPELEKTLRRIESLTIKDGTITIHSRERKNVEAEPEEGEAPTKEEAPDPDAEPKAEVPASAVAPKDSEPEVEVPVPAVEPKAEPSPGP